MRDEIRTRLPTRKTEEMPAYNPFVVNAVSGVADPFYVSPENIIFGRSIK